MLYIFFAYFIVQAVFALGFRTCIHNLEPPDGRGFSEPIKAYFRRKAAALQKINTGRLLKKAAQAMVAGCECRPFNIPQSKGPVCPFAFGGVLYHIARPGRPAIKS